MIFDIFEDVAEELGGTWDQRKGMLSESEIN
jgi:hypothetical protein